jgi:flagellin
MLPEAAAGQTAAVGTNTLLETSSSASVPSFTISFDGVTNAATGTDKLTLTIDGQTVGAAATATGGVAGNILDAKGIAALFDTQTVTTQDNITYTAKDNGDGTLTFTANAAPTSSAGIPKYTVDLSSDVTNGNSQSATSLKQDIDFTAGTIGTGGTNTPSDGHDNYVEVTLKDADGNTKVFTTSKDLDYTATTADIQAKLADAATADGSEKLSDYFTTTDGTTKITFTANDSGTASNTWEVSGFELKKGANTILGDGASGGTAATPPTITVNNATKGVDAYTEGLNGYVHYGTDNDVTTTTAQPDQLASTTLDLSKVLTNVADGTKIKLGEETYTFAVGDNSLFAGEAGAIAITEDEAKDADLVASKLTQAAANNETFSVGHVGGGSITLKQLSSAKDSTDMTTMEAFAKNIEVETVNTTASADALAKAQSEAADAAAAEAKKSPLMLQIGDTSESYNQLSVTIEDMHAEALGIDQISIKDQQSASDAINVIKNAINQVSSTRGTLGATQNRLEHTANNLSVMTENIQDAESTIRDTDIAEEMMSYTKNSILVQSAQAMLAQANTVPQGVLQLLQ